MLTERFKPISTESWYFYSAFYLIYIGSSWKNGMPNAADPNKEDAEDKQNGYLLRYLLHLHSDFDGIVPIRK